MLNILALTAMACSAVLIAAADALIKKVSVHGSVSAVFFDPWMIAILGLYFVQILVAIWVFVNKGELAIYGVVFVALYVVLMVLGGVFLFKEQLTLVQMLGILLALAGAILLNSGL